MRDAPGFKSEDAATLHETGQNYRALAESSPCALLVHFNEKVAFANQTLARLLGASDPSELLGRPLPDLVHPEWRSGLQTLLRQRLPASQTVPAVRQKWLRKDGTAVEVEVLSAPLPWDGDTAIQLMVRELAERNRMEHESRQVEQQIQAVADTVEDLAIFGLDSQAHVATWNRGAERVFGYSESEIVGRHFELLFVPEDRDHDAPGWETTQARETGLAQDERWHLRKDGSRLFVSGLLISVRNPAGQLIGFTKIARDETKRKSFEEALQQSESNCRQLALELETRVAERTRHLEQSVQAWEGFCYSIAHDLRAPLRTISGFAEALLDDYTQALDETAREYARRMAAAAHRLDQFIQDLLDFGRLAHVELPRQEVDLHGAIQQVLAELGSEIHSSQASIQLQGPFPSVCADPSALRQVITNLLTNAIKFVAPGATPQIEIQAQTGQSTARLWIRDHGIGIRPEHQERVFQLFERLHAQSEYPGTGAGLAIVQKAVERMGGQVGLESVAGEGASFWIELPLPQETAPAADETSQEPG